MEHRKTHAEHLVEVRSGTTVGDVLRDLYEVQGLSQVAIAQRLGVDRRTVAYWLAKWGVPVRSRG